MLICLLVLQLRGGLYVIVAAVAGVLSIMLSLVVPGNGHVVIAAVVAATVGLLLRRNRAARARSEE
jgi:predicted branched-subunit amino acid permease